MTYNLARAVGPALAALSVRKLGIPAVVRDQRGLVSRARRRRAPRAAGRAPARDRAGGAAAREPPARARAARACSRSCSSSRRSGFASDPINTEAPAFAHAFGRPDTDSGYLIGAFGARSRRRGVPPRRPGRRARGGGCSTTLVLLGAGVIGFSLVPSLEVGVRLPRGRRLRLSRVEHVGDEPAPTRGRRRTSAAGSWRSGALPSSACADRKPHRRRDRRRLRRAERRRRFGSAGALWRPGHPRCGAPAQSAGGRAT